MEKNSTDRLLEIVAKETGVEASDLRLATRLDSLVDDSLEFASLILEVELVYGKIPEEKIGELKTIQDLFDTVNALAS